ncbi:MAG: thioesterase family protein [Proteobacteria bacterium]|nr:thioesterase family protein [Pseudomonadota bacterium]
MPRVKVTRHPHYPHAQTLYVRVSDLNYGAHLGYDRILTLAHEARVRIFTGWQVTELDLGDGKTGLVAGDASINYLGEGFAGDPLEIGTLALEINPVTFRLAHRFVNRKTQTLVAVAEIGFVAFDYARRTPGRFPESFLAHLSTLAAPQPQ